MSTKTNRSRMTVAIAALAAMLMIASPVLATTHPISVQKTAISGAIVQVTVKNLSIYPVTGTVTVQAIVGDTAIWSVVPVVLLGSQTACVSAAFTAPVKSLATVSVQDDQQPY